MILPTKTLDDIASQINTTHASTIRLAKNAVEKAIELGQLLDEAKSRMKHGQWLPWLKANCSVSVREAQRYLKVYREKDRILKNDTMSHLTLTGALSGSGLPYTGNAEWYTPVKYVEAARTTMGSIDLDPASNDFAQRTVKAAVYFTEEDNGLEHEWTGNVFLNPPFKKRLIKQFVTKLVETLDVEGVAQAILLTNNSTDTEWWRQAHEKSAVICFTKRIHFYSTNRNSESPTNGQTIFYFGPRIKRFEHQFSQLGVFAKPLSEQLSQ